MPIDWSQSRGAPIKFDWNQMTDNLMGKQSPQVSQMQQALGPQSQAGWQLGTQVNPAGTMLSRFLGRFR